MIKLHSFHIPVMGIGFTVDSPLKVAPLGIDSVISLVDDVLLERLRKVYCDKFQIPYEEISDKIDDFRAKRITSYLNLINDLVDKKLNEFKKISHDKIDDVKAYFDLLPDQSAVKQEFKKITDKYFNVQEVSEWLKGLSKGSIDVNIMTKIDKDNYRANEQLPIEYNDAHAAVRGYANSNLTSSLVLSAGMNPRLYAYMEKFQDFYPNEKGELKKKIVLKVSDHRSALIQGKFLAKKGLWVSEFRIESGLNCGGHAFATDGFLMGPILEEFSTKREDLIKEMHDIYKNTLSKRGLFVPSGPLPIKLTAQGGVGTAEEHNFLIDHYNVDSVGWGSPFLLVPEAVSIDDNTLSLLSEADEEKLYLSDISPLGVKFNSLKGNTKDIEKENKIKEGKPGSSCPRRGLAFNREFTEKPICTASSRYQRLKIKELEKENLPKEKYQEKYNKIVEKSCICVGLGVSTLLINNLDTSIEGDGVSVCPGPNLAYFSKIVSLKDMVGHIYGRTNLITKSNRPHMFIKELNIYLDYLKEKVEDSKKSFDETQEKYLKKFTSNLEDGFEYYHQLFSNTKGSFEEIKSKILNDLDLSYQKLKNIHLEIEKL